MINLNHYLLPLFSRLLYSWLPGSSVAKIGIPNIRELCLTLSDRPGAKPIQLIEDLEV